MQVPLPSASTDFGWIVVISWVLWQLYAPKLFNVETRFQEVFRGLNERIDNVGNRLDTIEEKQSKIVAVTEVIAVETDDIDGGSVKEIFSEEEIIGRERVVNDDKPPHYNEQDNTPSTDK